MMKQDMIQGFACGPFRTNAYLIHDAGVAWIIDPSPGSKEYLEEAVNSLSLKVELILITHSHWDHIVDCKAVKEAFDAPVFIHPDDAPNLRRPGADGFAHSYDGVIEGVEPDGELHEGDQLQLGSLVCEVMHTPGHCPGHVCLYFPTLPALFCGDLFFHNAIGRIDMVTADPDKMWPSLERVAKLPIDTVVYPGHGVTTTIGAESWLKDAKSIYGLR